MAVRVMLILSALGLPGCGGESPPRSLMSLSGSPQHPCSNLSYGEAISARFRGRGRFVCYNRDSSDLIGICQAPFSGHNNYFFCKGPVQQPHFCGSRSLWWVRCSTIQVLSQMTTTDWPYYTTTYRPYNTSYWPHLSSTYRPHFETSDGPDFTSTNWPADTSRPFFGWPRTTTPPHFQHSAQCGCSWSSQHGCVVSGRQLLSSLHNTNLARRVCNDGPSEECHNRKELIEQTEPFLKCPSLLAHECLTDRVHCRWAAQGSGECGVNEENLIVHLVRPENRNHPLVKVILLSAHCHKHSETTCEGEKECTWVPNDMVAGCDVRPNIVVEMMFRQPELVIALQRSGEEAFCRSQGETGRCPPGHCRQTRGSCQHNPQKEAGPHSLELMMGSMCQMSWKFSNKCPLPCRPGSLGGCDGPVEGFVARHDALPRDSEHVVNVMALLMSSTMPSQMRCVEGNRHPEMCEAHACTQSETVGMPATGLLPSHSALGPGLKGVLREVSTAIASGQAGEFLGDHLENSPDTLQNLTQLAFDSVYSFFKTTPTPPAASSSDPDLGPEPEDETGEPEEPITLEGSDDVDEGPELLNPWVITGGAVLLAAVCSGVTLGLLCHARVVRGQAREPLLAGSAADAEAPSASVPAREQEMEPANAGDS